MVWIFYCKNLNAKKKNEEIFTDVPPISFIFGKFITFASAVRTKLAHLVKPRSGAFWPVFSLYGLTNNVALKDLQQVLLFFLGLMPFCLFWHIFLIFICDYHAYKKYLFVSLLHSTDITAYLEHLMLRLFRLLLAVHDYINYALTVLFEWFRVIKYLCKYQFFWSYFRTVQSFIAKRLVRMRLSLDIVTSLYNKHNLSNLLDIICNDPTLNRFFWML